MTDKEKSKTTLMSTELKSTQVESDVIKDKQETTAYDEELIIAAMRPTELLQVPTHLIRPGYNPKWVNDERGQVQKKLNAGYSFVKDELGNNIQVPGYPKSGLSDMKVVLMQCPKEITDIEEKYNQKQADTQSTLLARDLASTKLLK